MKSASVAEILRPRNNRGSISLTSEIEIGSLTNTLLIFTSGGAVKESKLADILQEYCDGNRNFIHTCVMICAPTSSKDTATGNIAVSSYSHCNLFRTT